jgi:cytochrome oxidase assembly protein ShyY1
VYRFLLRPVWLGRLAAALALATAMSMLGAWQLSRYEERAAVNARIDAADPAAPARLEAVLTAPGPARRVGPPPPEQATWAMVAATGRYDPTNQILVRGRTVDGGLGLELVTPLVLGDGSAVLVDRGWMPLAGAGAADLPTPPPPPTGEVTVVGRVRPGESGARPVERRDGALVTRRIATGALAAQLPYPVYGGYLLLDTQTPPADPGLTPVPVRHENAWLNAGYAVQWWIFAGLVLVGFAWLAHREAHPRPRGEPHPTPQVTTPEPPG